MSISRYVTFTAWMLLAFLGALNAGGYPADPVLPQGLPALPVVQAVSEDQIKAKISEIETIKDLDETLKNEVLEFYRQALTRLDQAGQNKAAADTFKEQITSAQERAVAVRQEVETLKAKAAEEDRIDLPAEETSKVLEPLLTQEQAALTDLKNQLRDLAGKLKTEQERPAQARQQLAEAQQKLEQIEKDLKAKPPADQSPLVTEASRAFLEARKIKRLLEVNMLEQEQLSYEARLTLLAALHEKVSLQVPKAEARVEKIQERISERRLAEAEHAKKEAEKAQEEAVSKHPAISRLAGKNVELSQELSALVAEVEERGRILKETSDQLDRVKKDFENTRNQVEKVGLSRVLGEALRNKRLKLPDIREYRHHAEQRKSRISEANLSQFSIQDKLAELENLDTAVTRILDTVVEASIPIWQRNRIQQELKALLMSQEELLKKLDSAYFGLVNELTQIEVEEKLLVAEVKKYNGYLTEKLLWSPDFQPMGWHTFGHLADAVTWFCSPRFWIDTWKTLLTEALDSAMITMPAVLIFILILVLSRRLRKGLESISKKVGKVYLDSFFLTLKALGITLLLAVPWPMLMFTSAWLLLGSIEAPDSAKAVGAGLRLAASYFLGIQFFRCLCYPKGILSCHFRWAEGMVLLLRRHLLWLAMILVPAYFLAKDLVWQYGENVHESLCQLAFVVALMASAVFFHFILRFRGGILESFLKTQPESWLAKLRYIWYLGPILFCLVLAILAVTGYYYTALQLDLKLSYTIFLLMGSRILYDLVLRGLLVAEHRMALAKARQHWEEAKSQRESEDNPEESEESGQVELDLPEMDLSTINEQTQKLLRFLIGLSVVVSLWFVWEDVLPALGIFEQVTLWNQTVVSPDGPQLVPVTLTNLSMALLVTLLTFVAAANIPGVLEITILRHLPMEPGSRYATTTVSRYVITGIGLFVAFGILGVSWGSLQWLVAALSVGLGFGLQEIVANFVSGLIILFERPIRVGDTVTVGGIDGTVSRIRMRATTITDWDRKELVVPNKEFITGQLINWTLSDPVTRIIISVGIAYGSDTVLANRVLEEVAQANPVVLDEPQPRVHFTGFGESSLDFEVRVFVRGTGSLMKTKHEIHMAIDKAFRENNIEISFPQRDLHVRSVDESIVLRPRETTE